MTLPVETSKAVNQFHGPVALVVAVGLELGKSLLVVEDVVVGVAEVGDLVVAGGGRRGGHR
jgi:hypothetical protein